MGDARLYTIGWICALETELVAARVFLDEEYDCPDLTSSDNNSYTLGKVGKHNVVIAVLPDKEYGTDAAAAAARDLIHNFPNVRVGLMVGVGGGAPSSTRDVRLGDIVVSSPENGHGGVFQYDFGKTIQERSFQETRFLNQPPTALRTAIKTLKARYDMQGHNIAEDVDLALTKIKKKKKYRRPSASSDRLYRSDIVHSDATSKCCGDVADDDPSHLVLRLERDEEDDDPAVHYGLVASANQLMKDAPVRDRLISEKGVVCFEMEAAGLMNHFPCLVIRGICDYSDSHKNKVWQGFAAMTAAAYAKDLLRQVSPKNLEEEMRIGEVLNIS